MGNVCPRRNGGFTLIELLSIVVILAILASIVIARFTTSIDEARQAAFVNDTRIFVQAADVYHARTGQFIPDSSSGQLPGDGFDELIDADKWINGTPIGGVWDSEQNENGVTAAIGVHFNGGEAQTADFMEQVDARFDDGDLATGKFRNIAAERFYYVMVD